MDGTITYLVTVFNSDNSQGDNPNPIPILGSEVQWNGKPS